MLQKIRNRCHEGEARCCRRYVIDADVGGKCTVGLFAEQSRGAESC